MRSAKYGLFVVAFLLCAVASAGEYPFAFTDVGVESGLLPNVSGIRGHAAGWGDVDGDGFIDLYVGTFTNEGSKANMLFKNVGGKFTLDDQKALQISTRASAALFVDLDNDSDLDLYVSSMPSEKGGVIIAPCSLFRNDGGGKFTDITKDNGACPAGFMGRSAAALDYDGDGLLDLLVGEDLFYSKSPSSKLFRNKGGLAFEDVTANAGIPTGIPAFGVAAADVDDDGRPDIFLASREGGNRLLLNGPNGRFAEPDGARKTFEWAADARRENTSAGVCFGDVNGDGKFDILVGQHFKTPWTSPVAIRLYLNRGKKDGALAFEDVTEAAGLKPLALKAPHVEIQDFDNDGRPDLYTSIVKFAGGRPCPVIFKNLGTNEKGLPTFRDDAMSVNDFPTDEDRALTSSGKFFEKMYREGKITYTAPGPSGDFNNDGKLDLFLAEWSITRPSLLLRNDTPGGHWLQVQMKCKAGINAQGIGTKIFAFKPGTTERVYSAEISAGYGYTSGQPTIAHLGLGALESVDLQIVLPHGKGTIERKGVKADQRITIEP